MRLYYYTASPPNYLGVHHYGQGFGSIFAKLFSKIAGKTAAKAALNVAKVAGKKAFRALGRQGTKFAKELAKDGLKELTKTGGDYTINKIQSLRDKTIKAGASSDLVHKLSDAVEEGVRSGTEALKVRGDKGINKLSEKIDNRIQGKRKNSFPYPSGKRIQNLIEES